MIEYMMCYKLMSLIVALMVATISWGQIWMEPCIQQERQALLLLRI